MLEVIIMCNILLVSSYLMFVSLCSVSHKISALLYHAYFLLSQVDQEDLLDKGVKFDLSVLVVTYSPSEEVQSGSVSYYNCYLSFITCWCY